jgi:hypothetical protein
MAITDYIPLGGATSPAGGTTDSPIGLFALKMAYEQTMFKEMQQTRSMVANTASRMVELEGYEKRIDRWNKATLQTRQRTQAIGADIGGVDSAETGIRTVVIRPQHFEYPEFFDLRDQMGTLGLMNALVPGGEYQNNVLAAMGRKFDEIFFSEILAAVNLGEGGGTSAYAGTAGNDSLLSDGTTGTGVQPFCMAKAVELVSILQQNDAFYDAYIGIHPIQVAQLFNDTTNRAVSSDFNAMRPLMDGEITRLLGCQWISCTQVPGSASQHRVYGWNSNAMVCGMGRQEAFVRNVPSRGNTELVYHGAFYGAVRVDDLGVTSVNNSD